MQSSKFPTDLELQILKILWDQSPLTARQIKDALAGTGRKLAHTSVITTLQKMVDKSQLKQLKPTEGKAYRFAPVIKEANVSQGMLGDLLDRVFDGSAEAVMLNLFEVSDLDAETLKRLRAALNRRVREKNND